MMTCETCTKFKRVGPDNGQCRAAPPEVLLAPVRTLAGETIQPVSVWPSVPLAGWCGQHQKQEVLQ
jgi:hypothetical protein